ncbi:hypothetical protein COI86_29950 [Bacillus thuringiensis]|nr:hypothetical protein COI86_29950 [Bacillus thuringiensis]PFN80907.1 hypothetical protein COJ76_31295 [Bacillus thuringiensis]PGO15645.1 hypothetical protein CN974_24815 [Bacillus thuringiensis]
MSRRNTVFREIEKLKIVNYSLLGKISKISQYIKCTTMKTKFFIAYKGILTCWLKEDFYLS